jgi:hypothetical protein
MVSGVFYASEINHSREKTEAALVEVQKTNDEKTELISWYKNGIMNSAVIAYKKQEYNTALNILEELHFVDAKRLKSEIFMIKQDYVKALEMSAGLESRSLKEALGFVQDLKMTDQGYLQKNSIIQILKSPKLNSKHKKLMISYHLEFMAPQEEKFEIIAELLKTMNGLDEIRMSTELREHGWYVDLSYNPGLRKSNFIEYLGDVDHLNVSHTGLNSLRSISKLSLRVLDAERVPVNTMSNWVNPYLEILNLGGASLQQVPNIKYLRSLKQLVLPMRLKHKKLEGNQRKVQVTFKS